MNFAPLDIFFAVIFLILTVRCIFRGFITEFMTIQAVVGGIILSLLFSPQVTMILDDMVRPSRWNPIIAFLVIFLVVYLVMKLLESLLTRFFERLNLENLDRSLGFFLGMIEGVLALFLLVYLISIQPFFDPAPLLEGSIVAKWVLKFLPDGLRIVNDGLGTLI